MRIVGLKYYKAREAVRSGVLTKGATVLIRHEPDNPNDPSAYEVLCGEVKVGHIPRFAATILRAAKAPAELTSVVSSVNADSTALEIRLRFRSGIDAVPDRHGLGIPVGNRSGVYAIVNVGDMRAYIGKAQDVERRRREHVAALQRGKHGSRRLQADWSKSRHTIGFVVLKYLPVDLLDAEEIRSIKAYGTNDAALGYNQGEGFSPLGESKEQSNGNRKRQRGAGQPGAGSAAPRGASDADNGGVDVDDERVGGNSLAGVSAKTEPDAVAPDKPAGPAASRKPSGCGCLAAIVPFLCGVVLAAMLAMRIT